MPIPAVRPRPGRARAARLLTVVAFTLICTQEVPAVRPAAAPAVAAVAPSPSASPSPSPSPSGVKPSALDQLAGPAAPGDLDVMTFNLKYASRATPNSWKQRRPVMRTLLTVEHPDLIGTQEGLPDQLRDIESDLGPEYDWIGLGRDGGDDGEHMAIFFDTTRLSPVKSGNYWLSTTPGVPASVSWGTNFTRMVTWVLFADLRTGRHFYAVNTHLDNTSENARRHAARLIRSRLAALDDLPIILTGDFNSPAETGSQVYRTLVTEPGYQDVWDTAPSRGPEYQSIHNYQPLVRDGERDDWILATPGVLPVAVLMNTYRRGRQYPSDHLPVEARIRLPCPDAYCGMPGGSGER
ncbi:endonuclease/exonuclease/phosphatase family protein [Actinoplanes sp. NPDC051851]|uniref:endonuclease/exonuclease/phosphatase family protein n=1 Tax=Actinoplanes sp. NPDC051851 TaxID=3154753 RepID=UPI003442114E